MPLGELCSKANNNGYCYRPSGYTYCYGNLFSPLNGTYLINGNEANGRCACSNLQAMLGENCDEITVQTVLFSILLPAMLVVSAVNILNTNCKTALKANQIKQFPKRTWLFASFAAMNAFLFLEAISISIYMLFIIKPDVEKRFVIHNSISSFALVPFFIGITVFVVYLIDTACSKNLCVKRQKIPILRGIKLVLLLCLAFNLLISVFLVLQIPYNQITKFIVITFPLMAVSSVLGYVLAARSLSDSILWQVSDRPAKSTPNTLDNKRSVLIELTDNLRQMSIRISKTGPFLVAGVMAMIYGFNTHATQDVWLAVYRSASRGTTGILIYIAYIISNFIGVKYKKTVSQVQSEKLSSAQGGKSPANSNQVVPSMFATSAASTMDARTG